MTKADMEYELASSASWRRSSTTCLPNGNVVCANQDCGRPISFYMTRRTIYHYEEGLKLDDADSDCDDEKPKPILLTTAMVRQYYCGHCRPNWLPAGYTEAVLFSELVPYSPELSD